MSPADRKASVTNIDTVVDLDLDTTEPTTTYPPFRVKIGGEVYELDEPDAGLVIELERARETGVILALVFDRHWPEVENRIMRLKKEQLVVLMRDYALHFDLDAMSIMAQAAPNREERRGRSRRRR